MMTLPLRKERLADNFDSWKNWLKALTAGNPDENKQQSIDEYVLDSIKPGSLRPSSEIEYLYQLELLTRLQAMIKEIILENEIQDRIDELNVNVVDFEHYVSLDVEFDSLSPRFAQIGLVLSRPGHKYPVICYYLTDQRSLDEALAEISEELAA